MKTTKRDENVLRITDQFRSRAGMNYDLKCDGARLSLVVAPRVSDEDPGDWRVEARSSQVPAAAPIVRWAGSRGEAVRDVGLAWSEQVFASGLPRFDWQAVAGALRAVRAI